MKRFQRVHNSWQLALSGALLASALLLAVYWDRGWIPHDEGTLAHSAERMLRGELPHRDFDDPYSGGLSALNAFAFRLFGVNLAAMRIMLVAFTLACVPAIFYLASRFTSYVGAAAVSFASIVWSVASYPAALPSWYNLFFALFGTAALVRNIETGGARWLVAAGVCGGLSIVFKTAGLYYVAAAVLFLVFREQSLSGSGAGRRGASPIVYSVFIGLALAAFVTSLVFLVRPNAGSAQWFQFVLPGAALAVLLASRELLCDFPGAKRLKTFTSLVLPFFTGLAIIIVPWLAVYAWAGAIDALLNGLFVLPFRRTAFAAVAPVSVWAVLATLPLVLLVAAAPYARRRHRAVDGVVFAAVAVWILWMAAAGPRTYRVIWYSLLTLIPVTVVAGTALLARAAISRRSVHNASLPAGPARRPQEVLLLLAMSAMTSLVQYPFTAPVYFCFVAPFALLAVLSVIRMLPHPPGLVLGTLLTVYTAIGLLYVNPGLIYTTRLSYVTGAKFERLAIERGGIAVLPADKAEYEELVALLRRHARSGYTYAAPDSPEVYFLSGLRNPTRTIFDFFERREGRVSRTLNAIDRHGVSVIAINRRPAFSGVLLGDLTWRLRAQFPHSSMVGRFEVRWR